MTQLSDEQIAGYAVAAGFPADQISTAVAVALAESSGKTDSENKNSNGSYDWGVWQINTVHGVTKAAMFDPAQNAAQAFKIWKGAGNKWTPWSVYKSGRYMAFMPRGLAAAKSPAAAGAAPPDGGGAAGGGNPFGQLFDGGLWLRLAAAILGGLAVLLAMARLTGVGSAAAKIVKSRIPVKL